MLDRKLHYDEIEDRLVIETQQDVTPIIEANKRQYDVDNKRYQSEALNHVARIPMIALERYAKSKGITYHELMSDEKLFKEFLNDPDNKLFRTKPGRI